MNNRNKVGNKSLERNGCKERKEGKKDEIKEEATWGMWAAPGRSKGKNEEGSEGGRSVQIFDSETWCCRCVTAYTCMVCPGSSVKEPYSLKMARGLARMALSTHVSAITVKHTSLRILVSRWYTIHLKCKLVHTKYLYKLEMFTWGALYSFFLNRSGHRKPLILYQFPDF